MERSHRTHVISISGISKVGRTQNYAKLYLRMISCYYIKSVLKYILYYFTKFSLKYECRILVWIIVELLYQILLMPYRSNKYDYTPLSTLILLKLLEES